MLPLSMIDTAVPASTSAVSAGEVADERPRASAKISALDGVENVPTAAVRRLPARGVLERKEDPSPVHGRPPHVQSAEPRQRHTTHELERNHPVGGCGHFPA